VFDGLTQVNHCAGRGRGRVRSLGGKVQGSGGVTVDCCGGDGHNIF
jgi:hypothetical protein